MQCTQLVTFVIALGDVTQAIELTAEFFNFFSSRHTEQGTKIVKAHHQNF
jgi:hypothetical protein